MSQGRIIVDVDDSALEGRIEMVRALASAQGDELMALSRMFEEFKTVVEPALAALRAKVADLEAKIAAGNASPEDEAFLQQVAQEISDIGKPPSP